MDISPTAHEGMRCSVASLLREPLSNGARENRLLAALPDSAYEALAPSLERMDLRRGEALHEPGGPRRYVYFPAGSIVSLLYTLENGASTQFAVAGSEGIVGICVFMGGQTASNRAVVQIAGCAYRVEASVLKRQFERSLALQGLLLRYAQALIAQMAQTAVCNRHHNVNQQLCRLLLLSLDRLSGNEVAMTHERIAQTLGVRRVGVTQAAGGLQAAGLIGYRRGHITVLDRKGLEERACECYATVKNEYDRLLTGLPRRPFTLAG
jgi:CRP-like cAMP-binding protein